MAAGRRRGRHARGARPSLAHRAAPTTSASRRASCPGGFLVLSYPGAELDPELVGLAFEEQASDINRLKARALALPRGRDRAGPSSSRRSARATRCGSPRPSPAWAAIPAGNHDDIEDAVLGPARPRQLRHPTARGPGPRRRAARRILQRLDGMGKWGGYHDRVRPPCARLRRQRPCTRAGGGRGAAGSGPARREALGRTAPRLPQPQARRRDPQADRHRSASSGYEAAVQIGDRLDPEAEPARHAGQDQAPDAGDADPRGDRPPRAARPPLAHRRGPR